MPKESVSVVYRNRNWVEIDLIETTEELILDECDLLAIYSLDPVNKVLLKGLYFLKDLCFLKDGNPTDSLGGVGGIVNVQDPV